MTEPKRPDLGAGVRARRRDGGPESPAHSIGAEASEVEAAVPMDGESPAAPVTGAHSRRSFLKAIGGGGIVICFALRDPLSWIETGQERRARGSEYPEDWNAYLRIGGDGRVTCYSGKAELGQGMTTALAMIVAEELDVPLDRVDTLYGDTDLCPYDMGTFGSRTIKYFGPPLRQAAAEGRAVLVALAAERLGVQADALATKDGAVHVKADPGRAVTYADLAKGRRIERHIIPKPSPKPFPAHAIAGKPAHSKDSFAKVTGRGEFAADVKRPGMLYAAILRPPAHGATLKSVDASGAERLGARVIEDGDLIAALHAAPDGARAALEAIEAEFEIPEGGPDTETIHERLRTADARSSVVEEKGDLNTGKSAAAALFEERWFAAYVSHAPIEPHAAVAEVRDGRATVWASTQRPFGVRDEVAKALGLATENVRVLTPYVGGGFGGKNRNRQAVEAARLAARAGQPVQVAWTREEEFFYDTFQPAAVVDIVSGLDGRGRVVLWDYTVHFAGDRSSEPFYDIPHYRVVARGGWGGSGGGPHPFETGAWRAPGSNTNTFARESHLDVMAAAAKADPVEFRMRNLADDRMIRVLREAAERFGWRPAPAPSGRGQGVSLVDYLGTHVATMAQVRVDEKTGRVRVERLVAVQDMGEVINPDGARAQMEGSMTMGLGYALSEEIRFRGGRVLDLNFDTYALPRFSWLPEIETHLVDNPGMAPQGGGEPPIVNMGAVIGNAIYDAVGARLKRLPMTPARVKDALAKRGAQ